MAPRTYGNTAAAARPALRPEPPPEPEEWPAQAERGSERPPRANPFDVVWPARARENRPSADDGGAPAAAPSRNAAASFAQPAAAAAARSVPEAAPVSILKSGVIDGMAYTLYTDGSIEAQLPQGTMRFASIEELRVYLEKNP